MLFAALELDREPLKWSEFPAAAIGWVQTVGAVAFLALLVWFVAYLIQGPLLTYLQGFSLFKGQQPRFREISWTGEALTVAILAGVAVTGLVLGVLTAIAENLLSDEAGPDLPGETPPLFGSLSEILLTAGALAALLAVAYPVAHAVCTRLSARRIWALARVSLKEAVRSRVVLIFSLMAVIFLFADWFVPYKPEHQLRNYVRAIYWSMPPLFLLTAGLLGAFSIPNDLRSQAMFTIVTKPVERMEIVLGRFLGYGMLLTAGMLVLSALSLLYLVRGVGDRAKEESFRARMPIYGDLRFAGTGKATAGDNVGRVWDYRSYIMGKDPKTPNKPHQYAIWSFSDVPDIGDEPTLQVQITLDIFRLNKGREGQGVPCTFFFADGRLTVAQLETLAEKHKARESELYAALPKDASEAERKSLAEGFPAKLAGQFGLHVIAGKEVTDYHTQTLEVPASLLAKVRESASGSAPPLRVYVRVDEDPGRQTQIVGMAQRDLYLLPAEGPFWLNFFKGMIGMWFTVMLILGLAIAISTYLSGVIAWLCTMFLFGAGLFNEFIKEIALGKFEGGGPVESAVRVATNKAAMMPLEGTAHDIVKGVDAGFRWILRRFLDILPDVDRFDLHEYVASGFDIPWSQVLLLDNLIPLIGYLLPWGILAYYLMRFREVANPN
jgi:hypothetical protein